MPRNSLETLRYGTVSHFPRWYRAPIPGVAFPFAATIVFPSIVSDIRYRYRVSHFSGYYRNWEPRSLLGIRLSSVRIGLRYRVSHFRRYCRSEINRLSTYRQGGAGLEGLLRKGGYSRFGESSQNTGCYTPGNMVWTMRI